MNVRAYAQHRHAASLRVRREPTLAQLMRSISAYARASADALSAQATFLEALHEHALQLARQFTRDLALRGEAYVDVGWDDILQEPRLERIDPSSIRPTRSIGEVVAERIAASLELQRAREQWQPRTLAELDAEPGDV